MSLIDSASLIVTPNGYKEGKLYSVIPSNGSGDMSVVRATTATRVNSAGLVELVPYNQFTWSQNFDNAAWNKTNCSITANNTTAPDGTITADKLILANGQSGSSSDGTGIRQLVDIASGSYTYSIYAKAAEFTTIRFRENQVTGAFLTIDLTNGAITNGDVVQYINPTATLVSNGWYRITFQTPTLTALYKYSVRVSETGNGTSGIFIWGYQVELGSYSTSYIPTTSASVTRNADVISKTGISSLIGQTEGVIFYDFILSTTGVDFTLGNLYSSSNGNSYSLLYINPSNQIGATIINNGSTECEIVTSSLSLGRHKIAFAYKANDFAVYIDGALQGTDTSGSVPAMDSFNMVNFNLAPNAYRQEVNIYSSALWKTRLTNNELERLTGTGFNTYAEMANYYNYITQ